MKTRLTEKTKCLVRRRWRAFCEAVKQAEAEHGRPLECYFGEGQCIADGKRLEEHHEDKVPAGPWDDGGCILIPLPDVDGFHQDGGGW